MASFPSFRFFRNASPAYLFLLLTLFFLCCVLFLMCLTPPVSRDALVHHLTIPKLYLKHGGMVELPHLFFSYFPGNLQLLFMIPLYFENDIVPKLIHWAFGIGTAFLVFSYLRKRTDRPFAVLGAIFFLSIPAIVRLAISAYVDLGLIFFSTGALLCFLRWSENVEINRYFWGSAVLSGLALGTKYNGLILLFVMTCFVALASARRFRGRRGGVLRTAGMSALFAAVALLVFSPWMIRNFVWTNNPLYPLYQSVFESNRGHSVQDSFSSTQSSVKVSPLAYRRTIHQESWAEIILLPVRLFFQGEDDNARLFDGRLNPGLLILPFFAFGGTASGRDRCHVRWMALFSLLVFCYTILSTVLRARYLVPIVPPLVILAMLGVNRLWHRIERLQSASSRKFAGGFFFAAIAAIFFWNAMYIQQQFSRVRPLKYLAGEVSRDEYIRVRNPEYSAMRFINGNLPANARILFFFVGRQGYYCDRDFLFDHQGRGRSFLLGIIQSADSTQSVKSILRSQGITHFLVRISLFQRWINEDLQPHNHARMKDFLREETSVVFSGNGYAVFLIK